MQNINIFKCTNITDKSIIEIANMCPLLESLNFLACGEITDTSVIAIKEKCPLLYNISPIHYVGPTGLSRSYALQPYEMDYEMYRRKY